jgi:hypothetical protein
LLAKAGGADNFVTFAPHPGLKIHRRRDDMRVRQPVNGRRGFKTIKFTSMKNNGKDVHCESQGEYPLRCCLEVHPSIVSYRDQHDLVEIEDEQGAAWACPDAFAVLHGQAPVWIEGKYGTRAVRDGNQYTQIVAGLDPKVKAKLGRIQRAFAKAGLKYVVVDQSFCRHPTVLDNVNRAFWHRAKQPSAEEAERLTQILSDGPVRFRECRGVFAHRACPEEWLFASVARGLAEYDIQIPFTPSCLLSLPTGRPFWLRPPASHGDLAEQRACS